MSLLKGHSLPHTGDHLIFPCTRGTWVPVHIGETGGGREREGAILEKGSKKGFLPASLPCSQLEGGCRASQTAEH